MELEAIFVRRDVAAAAVGISVVTLDKLIKAGRVEIARIGRRVLVRRESLERLAENAEG